MTGAMHEVMGGRAQGEAPARNLEEQARIHQGDKAKSHVCVKGPGTLRERVENRDGWVSRGADKVGPLDRGKTCNALYTSLNLKFIPTVEGNYSSDLRREVPSLDLHFRRQVLSGAK